MSLEELFNKLVEKYEKEMESELVNRIQRISNEKLGCFDIESLTACFIDNATRVAEDKIYRKISEIKRKYGC